MKNGGQTPGILFVKGARGSGKSSLILRALASRPLRCAGYYTARTFSPEGEWTGFCLRPARGLKSMSAEAAAAETRMTASGRQNCFLRFREGLPVFDRGAFASQSLEFLMDRSADLYLLDETGGPELLEERFWRRLVVLLSETKPVLLVFKLEEALSALAGRLLKTGGMTREELAELRQRRAWIEARAAHVIEVKAAEKSRLEAKEKLLLFLDGIGCLEESRG